MMKNIKRIPFTERENYIIRHLVKIIGEKWDIISEKLPGRTPKQIHDKYVNYLRDGLIKAPWTSKEDDILIKLYKTIGPKWTKMMIHLPGRSGNDIKNRWHKHLYKILFPTNDEIQSNDSIISEITVRNLVKDNSQYLEPNVNIGFNFSSFKTNLDIQEIIDESKIFDLDFPWM